MTEVETHLPQEFPSHDLSALGGAAARAAIAPVSILESEPSEVNLGLLTAGEYHRRRSGSILGNPEIVLDEETEITKYFTRQGQTHTGEIGSLASLDNPMRPTVRIVVPLIAYGEGTRIKHTLEEYAKQNIDPNLYEIVLLDNHPEDVADDSTADEVAVFQKEHPEIALTFAQKVWGSGEPATVGNARRYAFDIAQARILARGVGSGDTILVSNDADAISIPPDYLSVILHEFDTKPQLDALATPRGLPDEVLAKPNVAAAFMVLKGLEESLAAGSEMMGLDKEPAALLGSSSAVRASMYAAVGGFNQNAVLAEDVELGWLIADARNWNPERIIQLHGTSIITDPRRHLDAIANQVPIDQMLYDFHKRPDLRHMNNDELLRQIPDDLDWELLQDEVDSTWHSQFGGNRRFGDRFEPLFNAAMTNLGISYEVVDGRIALKNLDGLLDILAKDGKRVMIVHSKQREYTQELIGELRTFFGAIPKGVIEARAFKRP